MTVFMKKSVVILFILTAVSCSRRETAVAWFGRGNQIDLKTFKEDFLKGKTPESASKTSIEDRKSHVLKMIDSRIKVLEAYRQGLDEDSVINARITPLKQNLMLRRLYEVEIVDRVIPEKDIRDFYTKSGRDVIFRDILLRADAGTDPGKLTAIQLKADSIIQRLRKGEDFARMAREFSEDEQTALKGGLMGAISWNRSEDPVLNALYSLDEGELSAPVRNNTGFHILKVESIRKKDRKPYAEVKDEIKKTLNSERSRKMQMEARSYQENLLAEADTVWSNADLGFVVDLFKSRNLTSRDVVLDSLMKLGQEDLKRILVKYRGGSMNISQLVEKIKQVSRSPKAPVASQAELKEFIKNSLLFDLLMSQAEKRGLERDATIVNGMKERLEEEISALLIRKEIVDHIDPSQEDIMAYFDANPGKYSEPEKVRVQEIMVKDKTLAESLMKRAKGGENFSRLVQKYTERPGYAKQNGILGPFSKGAWGSIGVKAFEMKPGEIAGPIDIGQNKGYSVIKLLEKTPAIPKPYENVKAQVARDLRSALQLEKEAQWFDEKRKEYRFTLNEEVLKSAF